MLKQLSKYALILFILIVAIAAFGHSAWVISTMFGGKEPAFDPWLLGTHFNWASSGWLVAFALDFGMFVISHDIQENRGNGWKWVAFGVLSLFTYSLQLTYMAIHKDPIALGGGVKPEAAGLAQFVLDYGLYWFPLMLPMSTAIYTLAYREKPVKIENSDSQKEPESVKEIYKNQPILEAKENTNLPEPEIMPAIEAPKVEYTAKCEICGWEKKSFSETGIKIAQTKHMNTHKDN